MSRHRVLVFAAASLIASVWAYACGDGATEPPPPDPPRATTVTVNPATASLGALEATLQLSAEVRDQNAQAMTGAAVAWSSDDAAITTVDASGLVTAVGKGTAIVTATAGSASGTATVTVAQIVAAVTVSPGADTLVASDTLRLSAAVADANGHPVVGAEFSWMSGDTAVAVVDATGLVTGVGAGQVEITATSSGVMGRAVLTVLAPVPTIVAVTPDTVALSAIEQTIQLTSEVRDQLGRVMADAPLSWSSADTLVARVDSAGLVTAAGVGATMVTAAAGEASGTALVTVTQATGSVVVSPPADTIGTGDTLRLAAEAYDANGHPVTGAQFSWSSSDASVATVDSAGLVQGQSEGTATITAASGDARGTSAITVRNPDDRAALVALYHATDGPNWVNSDNWLTDAPLREWYGVHTDGFGRVVELNLRGRVERNQPVSHGLAGPIPAELASLTNLQNLQLGLNELTGPIPPELGKLAGLTFLALQGNNLTGPIPPELGDLTNLRGLILWGNALADPIPPELGDLTNLTYLHFASNSLTGPIPPELGSLIHLRSLILYGNELEGPIPRELGNLDVLRQLELAGNSLTGPIPQSVLQLSNLMHFHFQTNDGLCAPGTTSFVGWLEGLSVYQGAFCNQRDRELLELLYERAGGSDWTEFDGWLATQALEEWHGVEADSLGRVVTLDLTRNNLTGSLPSRLGDLAEIIRLHIGANALSGRLPLSLAELQLVELDYGDTELCAPTDASFQAWLKAIPSHEGTGIACAALSDREVLEVLYETTGGDDWRNSENWLTDAPLGEWHGVRVDDEGRVVELGFFANRIRGEIPPEIGSLNHLEVLSIYRNRVSGAIPPALGNLARLRELHLPSNNLEDAIPGELGNLTSLHTLNLANNNLKGAIPSELGGLTALGELSLEQNELKGSVPAQLGSLANLWRLDLSDNDLTGPIPPTLGDLVNLSILSLSRNELTGPLRSELAGMRSLQRLSLGHNNLVGPVPPEFGGLANLQELALSGNVGMSGTLPSSLTSLRSLRALVAGSTGLCAPTDPGFLEWLERLRNRRVAFCDSEPAMAYLVQAVQSREFPVPLVAGEEALLRVFVTAASANQERVPTVRATFYHGGTPVYIAEIPEQAGPIPTSVEQGSLVESASGIVPGEVVAPGLEMVIDIDPQGTLDPALGVTNRIPAAGRLSIDVQEMPVFNLTLIPFLISTDPDSAILAVTAAVAADPEGDEMLEDTRILLPVGALDVTAHEPVVTSARSSSGALFEIFAIRTMEGGTGYYMGMLGGRREGGGIAFLGGSASFAAPGPSSVAHELGHNMGLRHAPCGNAESLDPSYPRSDGSIGAWGYDFRNGGRLVPPTTWDHMSYCDPAWTSDYHFTNALRFRLFDEDHASAAAAASSKALFLWGGIGTDSVPFLEPAFVIDAPATLPDSAGEYRIAGRTESGTELFSLAFTMPEMAEGDGSSAFAFALPVRPGWEDDLASITLSGPTGSATLDQESDLPMAILRNPRTGQVRGILRDLPPATQAVSDGSTRSMRQGFEVLISRGIPEAAAWRR